MTARSWGFKSPLRHQGNGSQSLPSLPFRSARPAMVPRHASALSTRGLRDGDDGSRRSHLSELDPPLRRWSTLGWTRPCACSAGDRRRDGVAPAARLCGADTKQPAARRREVNACVSWHIGCCAVRVAPPEEVADGCRCVRTRSPARRRNPGDACVLRVGPGRHRSPATRPNPASRRPTSVFGATRRFAMSCRSGHRHCHLGGAGHGYGHGSGFVAVERVSPTLDAPGKAPSGASSRR